MFAHLPRQGSHLQAAARRVGARLGRLAAALAAVACGLLASAATSAAWARQVPQPGLSAPVPSVPATPSHVVIAGGMAGWQITLIALGAAALAAAVAVVLDRARAAHRSASASTA
jgi:hypothetical protein